MNSIMQRNFIVTGGSSGIGLAVIKKLSDDPSNRVISFSRSRKKIERAIRDWDLKHKNVEFIEGDVSNDADCKKLAGYLKKNDYKVHGLVNAAGVLTRGGIEMIDYEQWKFNLDVNLNGPYLLTRHLLPFLKEANGASIVNISSVASLRPGTSIAYSVSKAGLDMLTEFLAGDLAPYKIRVNSVNPGLVRTPIHLDNQIFDNEKEYEEMLIKSTERYPLKRIGEASEVASLICYLLEDESSWITGSIFKIDGGVLVYNDLLPPKNSK
ncbi:MAG: SDR family oxidoreductase [Bacteroidetes bacterium]|nr:MAG: SDR family oxidoreductase [Bacteroidota bacterium]